MPTQNNNSIDLDRAITSEDILGKDVIDPDGTFIGVTDKLLIDSKTLAVMGVSVDKGFLRKGLIIGASFIRTVTDHAVLLNTRPAYQIKGMNVFCADGSKVGSVEDITLGPKGVIEEIRVKTRMFRDGLSIRAAHIDRIEQSVILSISSRELEVLQADSE